MERTKTAIQGLDELINGGIPKGASVLVSGGTGTGKTIFASQFIYNGASMYKDGIICFIRVKPEERCLEHGVIWLECKGNGVTEPHEIIQAQD